jgi:transposase
LTATHPRTRERLLALHDIIQGACATQIAERTGRRAQTVMDWLHRYNEHGPEVALVHSAGPGMVGWSSLSGSDCPDAAQT